mgnify:CR=1 FL=1
MTKNTSMHCPVCIMDVDIKGVITSKFQGMNYHFCSKQCLERFKANPGLYIGSRGLPSPKQRGENVVVKRTLRLGSQIPEDIASSIAAELHVMMGIEKVNIEGDKIMITYDLLEVTAEQIESVLERIGNKVSTSFGESLKRAFIHYIEETILDNLEHNPTSHSHH